MTKFLKRCWLAFAILIVSAAIISSVFRALTPWAKQYKGQVENHLSAILGGPVSIHSMETGWYWFEPVIKLRQVNLVQGKKDAIRLNKLLVGINLWKSLWHWQIQPGILYIDDLHLNLRQTDNSWQIEGLSSNNPSLDFTFSPLLAWILSQQKIIIRNVSAQIYLKDGTRLPISEFNLTIANRAGHFRIKGSAWAEPMQTRLQGFANLQLDVNVLNNTKGQLFFAATHVLPAKWQRFFPKSRLDLQGGKGDIQLWAEIAQGQWQSMQTKLNFAHLAWKDRSTQRKQVVDSVKANLAWNLTKEGWQVAGDKLQLRIANIDWPENSFLIRYQQDQQAYSIFLKSLSLKALLAISLPWPESMKPLVAMKPTGLLHDMQFHIKEKAIDYALTGFSQLSWQAKASWPAVSNLAGVIRWSPSEGRLEVDSKNTAISIKNKPSIHLAELNTALSWKKSDQGLFVTMPQFALNHPDLGITAHGTLQGVSNQSPGQLQMNAEFSAKEVQQWLSYLPNNSLKPKLAAWLKNDIKRIAQLTGELHINGPLADFPFANNTGEFFINTNLSGVDLFFAPHWPLVQNIAGSLQVNRRALEVDITQAWFNDMALEKGNLRVSDLGLDHETIIFHGKMRTESDKAQAYILASPLKNKLSAISALQMAGLLTLDLQLEVPLYPEKEVAVVGGIDFTNNTILIHHTLDSIKLTELNGSLQFNQLGIIDSQLNAILFSTPVNLSLKSVNKNKSYTEVKINGKANTSTLGNFFTIPSFIEGEFDLASSLKLFDDPQSLSRLRLQTSLQGVKINLPPPLGKVAEAKAPLTANIAFNEDKLLRVDLDYDNRIKASKVANEDWAIHLDQKEFVANLVYQPRTNTITGQFTKLNLSSELLAENLNPLETNLKPSDLPNLDLQVASFHFGNHDLGELSLKTTAAPTSWQVDYGLLKSPFYQLLVKGKWQKHDHVNATKLQADLRITDLGKSLAQWDITPVIEAKRGDARFEGGWPGPFYDFSLAKLEGKMAISLKNGRITHLSPETEEKIGLGKLLSILSLQTIPRRIQLDFSDLSQDGYSFDEFKGNFSIANGVMATNDGYINGPVAHANIKGQLDIIKQLCDIKLRVSPHITASLPVVATIAGGPVAGIAAWAASKLINQGMQKISGYTYRISGPWQQPVVQHINIIKPKRA